MASIIQRRKIAQIEAIEKASRAELTFAEKNRLAWKLVKSGEAQNLKEAWQILRENGTHK